MKNYTEYNTKIGINELLSRLELDDEKGFVRGMHLGEMIASIKIPNDGFNYNENGELEEVSNPPQMYMRVDYLVSIRQVSFDFKIVGFRFLE
ncbi:MAG: hypothetical protein Q4A00_00715 [Flavobacteriaceae bacterium]|nr:hypothetical protein [Flavobacteriaceae bacterium]